MHNMLFQIENEYGGQSKLLGPAGQNYMNWAAKMAIETGTGVPWVMCKEDDAPDPVVSILLLPSWNLCTVVFHAVLRCTINTFLYFASIVVVVIII